MMLGIHLRDVSYHRQTASDFSTVLVINGTIENTADEEMSIRNSVSVDLTDSENNILYHTSFKPDVKSVAAGQKCAFRDSISNPPSNTAHLKVHLDNY